MRMLISYMLLAASACVGAITSAHAESVELPWTGSVPPAGETLTLTGRANEVDSGLTLVFAQEKTRRTQLHITAQDMMQGNHHYATSTVPEGLTDALLRIQLRGPSERLQRLYFIRPDIHFYVGDDLEHAAKQWETFPPASRHAFTLEVHGLEDHVELAIDGRHIASIQRNHVGDALTIQQRGQGELLSLDRDASRESAAFLPINIATTRSQGDAILSEMTLTPEGRSALAAAHIEPVDPARHVDVGLSRWLRQADDGGGYYNPDDKRSAWDNLPERIVFSVPRRPYTNAHFLCAIDHTNGRQPEMNVRIAHYNVRWDGSGPSYGDTIVDLSDPASQGVIDKQEVGSVNIERDGKLTTVPLYLITVPLATGELAGELGLEDWSRGMPEHFYLDLSRTLGQRKTISYGSFGWRQVGPQSGFIILGASLEKPVVELRVQSPEHDLVFYRDQQAELEVVAHNTTASEMNVRLSAILTDYEGQEHRLSRHLELPAGQSRHAISVSDLAYGWYGGMFEFAAADGTRLWEQRVSFALLPPDNRQATYETSPFGIWWFAGPNFTQPDPDIALPLVRKLGFRQVSPRRFNPKLGQTPDVFRKHGVLPGMMNYFRPSDKETVEERARKFMDDFPEVQWAMIFHETKGTGDTLSLPPELLGEQYPQRTEQEQERFEQLWEEAINYSRTIRELNPDMKLILGNGFTSFNVGWLRDQFPREAFDALGMEMAVQLFHPESQPNGFNLQSYWIADQMRKIYGYDDLPITDCFEVDYRSTAPGGLDPVTQADWYARDVLLRLAYRLPMIYVGLLEDTNNSYHYSRWGSSGVMERVPMMMPKPSFVSLSTLTRVLDQAEYQRWLPTGSNSVHCLEFKNHNGFVYAIWTSRAERSIELSFEQMVENLSVVHSAGYALEHAPGEALTVSSTPRYVVSPVRLAGVACLEPQRVEPDLTDLQVVQGPRASTWRIVPEDILKPWAAYEPLQQGQATLSGEDALEVTLIEQDIPDVVSQYIALEPTDGPVHIEGEPDTIGIWVNGNSNWGRVLFEVVDATGTRWISMGHAPGSWGMADWEGRTSIDFDGWHPITQPLPLRYPSGYYGPRYGDWARQRGGTSDTIVYPIELSRIYVTFRQKQVHVTEMVDATSLRIELGDIMAGNSGRALVRRDGETFVSVSQREAAD